MNVKLKRILLAVGLVGMIILGEVLLHYSNQEDRLDTSQVVDKVQSVKIVQEPIFKTIIVNPVKKDFQLYPDSLKANEEVTDLRLTGYPELQPVDLVSHLVGFLKAKEFDLAARLFVVDHYIDFFYRDYSELDDYLSRVHAFGEQLTRSGTLTHAKVQSEQCIEDRCSLQVDFHFGKKNYLNVMLELQLIDDGHEEGGDYYIRTPVEELLSLF